MTYRNLSITDRIINLFTFSRKSKIKMRCKYCGRPIFNLESNWAKTGQCIFCYEAEERGKKIEVQ